MKPLQVQRPRRNPNPEFVFYRRGGQAYLRMKAINPHNPRTQPQVRVRSAFRLMQETIAPIRGLFVQGFEAGARENGRRVSPYHMALGENLREAIATDAQGIPYVDYRRLKISRGMHSLSNMRVERRGSRLLISHAPLLDARYECLLVAVYSRERGEWVLFQGAADFRGAHHEVEIPVAWVNDSLHLYVGAGSEKAGKRYHCESQHFFLEAPAVQPVPTPTPSPHMPGGSSILLKPIAQSVALAPEGATVVRTRGRYVLRR